MKMIPVKVMFYIRLLDRISFIYNPTASFFKPRIAQWIGIEFKLRTMLFKKSLIFFILMLLGGQSKLLVTVIFTSISDCFSLLFSFFPDTRNMQ